MIRIYNSLFLLSILTLALACAKGSDRPGDFPSRSADGKVIPENIRNSLKNVPGGTRNLGQLKENVSFSTESTITYTTTTATIDSFQLMNSEVTVEMYVDFLNSEPFVGTADGSTGTTTSSTSSTTSGRAEHYHSAMNNTVTAGIYRTDSTGGLLLEGGETDQGSGTIGETTTAGNDEFRIKPSHPYSDPFIQLQKPRFNENSNNSSGTTDTKVIYEVSSGRSQFPIVYVSKLDAIAFCRWLGSQYRLPTGNEWEYAARGGRSDSAFDDLAIEPYRLPDTLFTSSDDEVKTFLAEMHQKANFLGELTERGSSTPVKSYPSNGYGLHDMMGNVYEWTANTVFDGSTNLTSSTTGTSSFLRGGSWASKNLHNLSVWGKMISANEDNFFADTGFRVLFQSATAFTAEDLSSTTN